MGYTCNSHLDISYTSHLTQTQYCNTDEEGDVKNGSSRWNPTAEQIMALEELYRGGTRTPSTQQIQEIASKLRQFGRIEGKNVFYWFQNHKARERQKRRRSEGRLLNNSHDHLLHDFSVLRRTSGHRDEQTGSCLSSSPTQGLVAGNDKENGRREDADKRWEGEKNATWGIPMITSNTSQVAAGEKGIIIMKQYNVEEDEERREMRTLDLFPVKEKREKSEDGEREREDGSLRCKYFYYYQFMPLKK